MTRHSLYLAALGSLRISIWKVASPQWFRITGGFSFFVSQTWSCRPEGAWTQWHIHKGPAGPPWLMMTPWRKKVWPLNLSSIPKGVSSSILAAHGHRDQDWPPQPGLPSDGPEQYSDTQPPHHPPDWAHGSENQDRVPTWESELLSLCSLLGRSPAALVVLASSSVQESGDRNHILDSHKAAQHVNPYSFQPYLCKSVSTCQITTKKPCLRMHTGPLHSVEALFLQVWFLYLQPGHQEIVLSSWILAKYSSGLVEMRF